MSRSPSLAEVISAAMEHRLSGVHVCMPGRIESYDSVTQTASVRPTIKNVLEVDDGETEALEYPVISGVPVAHPRAGAWFVHLPLTQGDSVMLVFGERSLERWRGAGGVNVDPENLRKHHLSDAIAIPCNLYPDQQALPDPGTGLVVGKAGGSIIRIQDSGEIDIGSAAPTDAVATANKVAATLQPLLTALALDLAQIAVAVPSATFTLAVLAAAPFSMLPPSFVPVGGTVPASVASSKVKVDP